MQTVFYLVERRFAQQFPDEKVVNLKIRQEPLAFYTDLGGLSEFVTRVGRLANFGLRLVWVDD